MARKVSDSRTNLSFANRVLVGSCTISSAASTKPLTPSVFLSPSLLKQELEEENAASVRSCSS
jgi:hypothetical protein